MSYDNTNTGALFPSNKNHQQGKTAPTKTGTLNVEGVEYWINGWENVSSKGLPYIALRIRKKEDTQVNKTPAPDVLNEGTYSQDEVADIPF